MVSKEDFLKVWKDTSRENILNQFYYEHKTLREQYGNWNELKKWLEECLNDLKQNDVYDRTSYETGQIIATECIIAKMQELEGNDE